MINIQVINKLIEDIKQEIQSEENIDYIEKCMNVIQNEFEILLDEYNNVLKCLEEVQNENEELQNKIDDLTEQNDELKLVIEKNEYMFQQRINRILL